MEEEVEPSGLISAVESPTFGKDGSFRLDEPVGSASISPCGRDVVLASRQGLHIIDLDSPWSPPRHLGFHTPWEVADVQWSPFAARDYWVVSTSNQKALVWNLNMKDTQSSVEHVLHAHTRAISDINFSAHNPDILATCAVDSFVHCWDIRCPSRPVVTFCDWFAGATQVKWNRRESHILASSHDKFLRIWDDRKGAYPLRSIEAHDTKIYGVDWDRLESTKLVTCSLDRSISFWDYAEMSDEPAQILKTDFPVWRARHTPFGSGLLVMPQRGDNNLHLYDRKLESDSSHNEQIMPVHSFEGHDGQVKEFLWRTRGNVTETMDDREYQLVSWGTDKVLRLHHVSKDVLEDVGYTRGMNVKRTIGFTRRGATYKTFRNPPAKEPTLKPDGPFEDALQCHSMRIKSSMLSYPGSDLATFGVKASRSSHSTTRAQGRTSKVTESMNWMRGVRIGKRGSSPSGLHQSVSSIISPNLRAERRWETFESLGEEITYLGDTFSKIKFDEVDMQVRRIRMSLPGPWGSDRISTLLKVLITFPNSYPRTAAPSITIEKTISTSDEALRRISSDVDILRSSFLSYQRSSLEAIVRYLLGEQTVEAFLHMLQKDGTLEDSMLLQDPLLNSSDEDEEDGFQGTQFPPLDNSIDDLDVMATINDAQYNVPLPKRCGAVWTHNGTLVCFFPVKQTLFDRSFGASDRAPRSHRAVYEGFGRTQGMRTRKKTPASTLETIEDDDPELFDDSYQSSYSDSSFSSAEYGMPPSHNIPFVAWRGQGLEVFHKLALDGSHRSSADIPDSSSSTASMLISLHDLRDLLPAKQILAAGYVVGNDCESAAHNAHIAMRYGFLDIAETWTLIELMLQNVVPLHDPHLTQTNESSFPLMRHHPSLVQNGDSAVDLSCYEDNAAAVPSMKASINWGHHPYGQQDLIKSLFSYYEQMADIQMLAMMSCVLYKANPSQVAISALSPSNQLSTEGSYRSQAAFQNFPASQAIASSPRSVASSLATSMGEGKPILSKTPPGYMLSRPSLEPRKDRKTSMSTSPKYQRHAYRSNSNLSALAAPIGRPFSLHHPATASPPQSFPEKSSSPVGSVLGLTPPSFSGAASDSFNKSLTIAEGRTSVFTVSTSDPAKDMTVSKLKTPAFVTRLMNQDQSSDESHATLDLLDPTLSWLHSAYREAYADLLDAWDLPTARCELLKYTESSISEAKGAQTGTMTNSVHTTKLEEGNIEVKLHCRRCANLLPTRSPSTQCRQCQYPLIPAQCLLCHTCIYGQASPCFHCGHILHPSCRKKAIVDGIIECPSGCGCICGDGTTLELEEPEQEQWSPCSPQGTGPAMIAKAEREKEEQTSTQQRQDGYENVAYESLTRNLRGERRGSGRRLTTAASQIWKGS